MEFYNKHKFFMHKKIINYKNFAYKQTRDILKNPLLLKNKIIKLIIKLGLKDKKFLDLYLYKVFLKKYKDYISTIKSSIKITKHDKRFLVLIPFEHEHKKLFLGTIDSCKKQIYNNIKYSLLVFSDADHDYVSNLRTHFSDLDIEITYVSKKNMDLALIVNKFKCDFFTVLHLPDLYYPNCFFEVNKIVKKTSNFKIIYSDSDRYDFNTNSLTPDFQTSFDFLKSIANDTINNPVFYDTDILARCNFKHNYFFYRYQDATILSISNLIKNNQIYHIPKVLYSSYLPNNHLEFSKLKFKKFVLDKHAAVTKYLMDNKKSKTYKVSYLKKEKIFKLCCNQEFNDLVSIIIPTRDKFDFIKECIESIIRKTKLIKYEIIIIDNASVETKVHDFYKKIIKIHKNIKVYSYRGKFNYSKINNFAALKAKGTFLLFLNNDTKVINSSWLYEMLSLIKFNNRFGCVGAKLLYANDTIQHAGVVTGLGGVAGHLYKLFSNKTHSDKNLHCHRLVSAVTGACLLVSKNLFNKVNGFDERLEVAFNDIDFCLKLQKVGYSNIWTPYSKLYHYESISRGYDDSAEKKTRFANEYSLMFKRYGPKLKKDPYYSLNLTKKNESGTTLEWDEYDNVFKN